MIRKDPTTWVTVKKTRRAGIIALCYTHYLEQTPAYDVYDPLRREHLGTFTADELECPVNPNGKAVSVTDVTLSADRIRALAGYGLYGLAFVCICLFVGLLLTALAECSFELWAGAGIAAVVAFIFYALAQNTQQKGDTP